ncbi:class I SAM-dependent RNA methyltransferase [Paenibacillus sp. MER TA 81-3]|uniref:THUMP domain-containing class I SAM-dependent RNA methyltransferase n=1 Tax=Paenibacillus sp. MER TA 81-3 TaxID=2939573 RepID=UPI0020426272|nr:class I SAM-dependent RNA methyltransferase [Paenibacillus sp. MER TA 81-3]MCM3340433.1 class I SAM-dependent RNA methyltransferase [Paenibacillus sp. MER TA 81-3]
MNRPWSLIATAPMGLEAIVARELHQLGYEDAHAENGRVHFKGGPLDVCRTNLWLRTADRVLINMGEFPARTFEELFEGTKAIPWHEWIPAHGEFPVDGRSHKSQLSSVPACQGIVKKAIVEQLKQHYHIDWFEETGPLYRIEISLLNDRALLTLDTTGPGLHKRGYRKLTGKAPLKETMAAALVQLSRWNPNRPLYDPFCGSGTILIEAAMIGWNVAPGLRRSFPAEAWHVIEEAHWETAREEAFDSVKDDIDLQLTGSDIDAEALHLAEAAAKSAGFSREINFHVTPVAKAKPEGDYGVVITNPPYGERLNEKDEVERMVRQLGFMAKGLPTWSFFTISPNRQFEHYFGKPADKRRKLFNGNIECQFYQYFGPLPPRPPRELHSPEQG